MACAFTGSLAPRGRGGRASHPGPWRFRAAPWAPSRRLRAVASRLPGRPPPILPSGDRLRCASGAGRRSIYKEPARRRAPGHPLVARKHGRRGTAERSSEARFPGPCSAQTVHALVWALSSGWARKRSGWPRSKACITECFLLDNRRERVQLDWRRETSRSSSTRGWSSARSAGDGSGTGRCGPADRAPRRARLGGGARSGQQGPGSDASVTRIRLSDSSRTSSM